MEEITKSEKVETLFNVISSIDIEVIKRDYTDMLKNKYF
jgi:hypothetical protein